MLNRRVWLVRVWLVRPGRMGAAGCPAPGPGWIGANWTLQLGESAGTVQTLEPQVAHIGDGFKVSVKADKNGVVVQGHGCDQ